MSEGKVMGIVISSPKHGEFITYVDEADYHLVSGHTWRINKHSERRMYAMTNIKLENGKQKAVKMHRLILGFPKYNIDHIDNNGLNNCRSNLRKCNHSQNGINRGLNKNNTIGYKGVVFMGSISHTNRKKKWHSHIKINYKGKSLGYFHTAEEAAKAYNEAAIKYFGEFASLNEIP